MEVEYGVLELIPKQNQPMHFQRMPNPSHITHVSFYDISLVEAGITLLMHRDDWYKHWSIIL